MAEGTVGAVVGTAVGVVAVGAVVGNSRAEVDPVEVVVLGNTGEEVLVLVDQIYPVEYRGERGNKG